MYNYIFRYLMRERILRTINTAMMGLVFLVIQSSLALAECDLVPNGTTILSPETRPAGTIIYNSDYKVLQECKSTGEWQAMHTFSSAPAPSGCDSIGDQ